MPWIYNLTRWLLYIVFSPYFNQTRVWINLTLLVPIIIFKHNQLVRHFLQCITDPWVSKNVCKLNSIPKYSCIPECSRPFTGCCRLYGVFGFSYWTSCLMLHVQCRKPVPFLTFLLTLTPYFLFLVSHPKLFLLPVNSLSKNLPPPYSHCHCVESRPHHLSPELLQ